MQTLLALQVQGKRMWHLTVNAEEEASLQKKNAAHSRGLDASPVEEDSKPPLLQNHIPPKTTKIPQRLLQPNLPVSAHTHTISPSSEVGPLASHRPLGKPDLSSTSLVTGFVTWRPVQPGRVGRRTSSHAGWPEWPEPCNHNGAKQGNSIQESLFNPLLGPSYHAVISWTFSWPGEWPADGGRYR